MHAAIERRDLGALRSLDPKPQLVLDCARLAWTDGLASLAERGGNLNSLWRGYRPLHAAIQEDAHAGCKASVERLRCIEWLLAHGADPGLTGAWPPARASLVAAS